MKAVSGTQMHELDQKTIQEGGIPGTRLMRIAGALAAGGIMEYRAALLKAGIPSGNVVILAGKGNNAGDAFVVARMLANSDCRIFLHCAVPENELSGDALTVFQELPDSIRENISYDLIPDHLDLPFALIIDGLLGTGFKGELKEPYRSWCQLVNQSGHPVVSLDIPTGLNADNGEADPDAIVADLTLTMAQPKVGMFSETGTKLCGRIQLLDIGIPAEYSLGLMGMIECTTQNDVAKWIKKEEFDIHKYDRGHLLIAGGSRDFSGAPMLSAEAALRTGAGLTTCLIPQSSTLYCSVPKALILRKAEDSNGYFSALSIPAFDTLITKAAALVLGPGMGTDPESVTFLEHALKTECPLLLDADALNLLAAHPELAETIKERSEETVLTPHGGELKRLCETFGITGDDRKEQGIALAEKLQVTLVVKGARTLVISPNGAYAVNLSGSPALATAGSGDVLAGMIGAMLMNPELSAFNAARAAVFIHGLCAELLCPAGSRGIIADDLLKVIGEAIRKVRVNA